MNRRSSPAATRLWKPGAENLLIREGQAIQIDAGLLSVGGQAPRHALPSIGQLFCDDRCDGWAQAGTILEQAAQLAALLENGVFPPFARFAGRTGLQLDEME